jgi:hypothetical protein
VAFQFHNETDLTIQVSICRNAHHRDPQAVVVVFSPAKTKLSGPVLKTHTLRPGQQWRVRDFGYQSNPSRVVDRLALKCDIKRYEETNLRFRLQGLWN